MRNCLLIAVIALCAFWNTAGAQGTGTLFEAPDTVCINQPVKLVPTDFTATSYYWNFCSGFLANDPVTRDLGNNHGFNNPQSIEIARDGNNYFAFVASRDNRRIYRLAYGPNLADTPVVTVLPLVDTTTIPQNVSSVYIVQDSGRWFLFAAGGNGPATSSLARYDFGSSLGNAPTGVNFGNPGNLLAGPRGLFVSRNNTNNRYYGFVVNNVNNRLIRFDLGSNISLTPVALTTTNLGNIGGLNGPNDIGAIQDSGKWFFLVPNVNNNTLTRIRLDSLDQPVPIGLNMGTLGGKLFSPSSVTIVRDCGIAYGFLTNRTSSELVRVNMPWVGSPVAYNATNLGSLGGNFLNPAAISNVVRKRDSLFAFVVNGSNSLTQVLFPQCTSSTIPSSASVNPPVYEYHTPGLYNVVLSVNEGQPNARVECKQIRALPIPALTLSPKYPLQDFDTALCQSDSIFLLAQVSGALSYTWSPNMFIYDSSAFLTLVAPEYSIVYSLVIPFANGCIIDTTIRIKVNKNHADAGYDRTIVDGASTTLGGPYTTLNFTPIAVDPNSGTPLADSTYVYEWFPAQYLNDPRSPYPVSTPAHDYTYYLTIRNAAGCVDTDTVVVRVDCRDLYLPNAFSPDSRARGGSATFGLLNRQIVKLNHFRIFDRWGKEVFSTTDPTKEWDGTINGDPAPFGVYVWTADGFCSEGKRLSKSGNVTLLR